MDKSEAEDMQKLEEEVEKQHFHVLAVDDSLIDRKLLERLLTVSSYQAVTSVESGDKALEYLGLLDDHKGINNESPISMASSPPSSSASPPRPLPISSLSSSSSASSPPSSPKESQQEVSKVHLIMTDYSMPGISGYDLLKRVKGSSWKDVPVVVMSSENVPSRINMCLEGGAEEFLLKPVKLSDLSKLQSYLLNSISHAASTDIGNNNIVDGDFKNSSHNTDENNNNNNDNNNDKCYGANKRKAASSDQSDRRPKLKEVLVL